MMDRIRQRAQSLLEKLHGKYGIEPKHPIHLVLAAAVCRKVRIALPQGYLLRFKVYMD